MEDLPKDPKTAELPKCPIYMVGGRAMILEAISYGSSNASKYVSGLGKSSIQTTITIALIVCLGIVISGRVSAQTFDDVPTDYWAFSFIEGLAASGITSGCGGGNYCPEDPVTRAQMAVFLERGIHGSDFSPPAATGNTFLDVGASDFAASFIEQLFLDGITAGCGNNNYCPNDTVTRAQMAVFLLRAEHGAGYTPPPATGVFNDVDLSFWAVAWIEQLAAESITVGCGGSNYCPENPVTRAQMAVFLVRIFSPPKVSALMTPEGGAISIHNFRGDLITLELPPDALREETLITVTALNAPPAAPFAMNLFPGVILEPHRLILEKAATLRVSFSNVQTNPELSLLFWVVGDDLVIPLANQTTTLAEISGDLYHFSSMTGGQPSAEEADEQARLMEALEKLGWLDDPFGWSDTQDVVNALMSLSDWTRTLGNDELADEYLNLAMGALEQGTLGFLNFSVPSMPCEGYTPILHKYLSTVKRLFGDGHELAQLLTSRLLEIDSVWCCFSLTGVWSATEIADETACDEGVNTYTVSVTLTQTNNLFQAVSPGGSASGVKTQCAITGWGGESEDLGFTYSNGSGTISADGKTINVSASWTWSGIDESTGQPISCSGTSNITLTR